MATLYDFSATTMQGEQQALSDYRGKVVLVVNTASECGYTPQYDGLQALYQQFDPARFVVLGFPCNQFGAQEPQPDAQIAAFCQQRFAIRFPLFAKCEVNGPGAVPLWQWLTQAGSDYPQPVKWNFTKFLINQQGRVVMRYAPVVEPVELLPAIQQLLL
jgi:glutathione peroxidase